MRTFINILSTISLLIILLLLYVIYAGLCTDIGGVTLFLTILSITHIFTCFHTNYTDLTSFRIIETEVFDKDGLKWDKRYNIEFLVRSNSCYLWFKKSKIKWVDIDNHTEDEYHISNIYYNETDAMKRILHIVKKIKAKEVKELVKNRTILKTLELKDLLASTEIN